MISWDEFASAASRYGIEMTPEMVSKFGAFEERLYEANRTTNLTRVPREESKTRHFLDSLALSQFVPEGAAVLDIGSGAGFPGVPLAIARPDLTVTLLDAGSKEIRFLESQADLVTVGLILDRAEIAARNALYRERYDVATGRAVAPLTTQAEISAAFVRVGGLFLPQRTEADETPSFEVLGLELADRKVVEVAGARRLVPIYRKLTSTPDRFPRTWAAIKKRPL